MRKQIFLASCLWIVSTALAAQAALQTPDEFLPHRIGEQFSEHGQLVAYYQYVAANSDRVQLVEFGRTNELRPQILAIVSTPENLRRIEEIRLNNLRNAGLADGQPDNANPIAIVWLGFSVHGNEAAGSEASMPVLYELANPNNKETSGWLKNTVVLIEPSVNPDGYSRYTSWYRQASPDQPDPDPKAREHNEPWPGGRVNHYLFDLNRDWAWATQVETQNRLKIYNDWLPQVVADLHEQYFDAPYYFAPAAQPFHKYLTQWQADFQVEVGMNHARYFDKNGWLYYTREIFDLFYPSYGDTYPCFNGAIGMTYEQGGHSRGGRAITMPNGDTLTLHDRVEHHTTTALSTVEVASKNAPRLVKNFAAYFNISTNNPPGPYKAFIIKSSNPRHKLKALTALLDRQRIQYGRAGKASGALTGYNFSTGSEGRFTIGEDDLIISAYQPKGLFAQVLLEPEPQLVDSLTYDITAWSLLFAYGLDAYAVKQRVELSPGYAFVQPQKNQPKEAPYAYIVPWNTVQSARLLGSLQQKGVVVRFAEEGFESEGKKYPAGTLIFTRADNRKNPDFNQTLQDLATAFDLEAIPVETGWVSAGHDFGAESVKLAAKPKVLVLSGEKTSDNEFGQVWFYFDKVIDYPATIIDAGQLSGAVLADFNTLVLPEGSYAFDDPTIEMLGDWVNKGGRLIAIGAANLSLADRKGFNLAKFAKDAEKENAKNEAEQIALDHRTALYADRVRSSLSDNLPGAIVQVKMDPTHPLAFGLRPNYFSLKTNNARFDLLKDTWNVGYLEKDFTSLGFIGYNLKKNLKDSAVFAVQDKGQGKVIYLLDNPLFRSFWEEGKLLFSNALFLVN
ncbi:MAG: zinc carboxypeptidase [Lewinellaceae bacterium]|nr:zinc carboxypeptidase [Saprospiraceae bacterium]MCB9337662.1 zinc carboxypeptidase [Lewinellaceae bacterium]